MSQSKPKVLGQKAVTAGWVFNAIAGLQLLVWHGPYTRDPSIDALLTSPSVAALAGTIGVLIGSNLLTIPPFVLGLYALTRKKNPSGMHVLICSLVIFLGVSIRQFMPSSAAARSIPSASLHPVSDSRCEFSVTFPHATKERSASFANFTSRLVESADTSYGPYLRAEFMPLPDPTQVRAAFRETLSTFAHLGGIGTPEITVGRDENGQMGTYSGLKSVGEHSFKVYGKVYLGESSLIHCMVVEPLDAFPSEQVVLFLDSIGKKKPKNERYGARLSTPSASVIQEPAEKEEDEQGKLDKTLRLPVRWTHHVKLANIQEIDCRDYLRMSPC